MCEPGWRSTFGRSRESDFNSDNWDNVCNVEDQVYVENGAMLSVVLLVILATFGYLFWRRKDLQWGTLMPEQITQSWHEKVSPTVLLG